MAILHAIIEKQNLNGQPKSLPSLCEKMRDEYGKENIIAAVQFLVNEKHIVATDNRGIEQLSVPPKHCDSGTFVLTATEKGRDFYYNATKSLIDKLREMTRAEKIIYAAGGFLCLRGFEVLVQWIYSLATKPPLTP